MSVSRHGGCLIPLLLLLLRIQSSASDGEKKQNLPRAIQPIEYEMKLIPHIVEDAPTFYGESRILVEVLEETWNVTLHSKNLLIDEDLTSLVDANGSTRAVKWHRYGRATDFLVIEFYEPIAVGNYTLNLKFYDDQLAGMLYCSYVDENHEKKFIIYSRFYPTRARMSFPCWDDPTIKATFNLSIKHDPNVNAISYMPSRSEYRDKDDKVWINFEVTRPIPANRLEFFLSDFDCLRSADRKLGFCGRKEFLPLLEEPLEFTERAKPALEEYIGYEYKSPKLDQFVVPSGRPERWRTLIYSERLFDGSDPFLVMEKEFLEIAQNLAKHILRDSITLSSLDSLWIVEGLSYYLGYRIVDKLHPDWRQMDAFSILKVQCGGFPYVYLSRHQPLSSYNTPLPPLMSIRSVALLHMLSNVLTEATFNSGIRRFVKEAEFRSVTSDDLWNAMQQAYDESGHEFNGSPPIRTFMKSWSDQKGYPLVNVTRDYETGRVTITQKGTAKSFESDRFWIPINFATRSNPNFEKTTPSHWLKPEDECLIIDGIDKDDWIIVNVQLSGYYTVDYDETNWKRIAEYMNSENYGKIHVINRASLIENLFNGAYSDKAMSAPHHNLTTYLDLASYLVREDDFLPWLTANRGIGVLRKRTYGTAIDELVKKFYLGLADRVIRKLNILYNNVVEDVKDVDLANNTTSYTKNKTNEIVIQTNENREENRGENNTTSYTKNKTNEIVIQTSDNREANRENDDFFIIRYRNTIKYLACSLGHPSCMAKDIDHLRAREKYPDEIIPPLPYVYDGDCDNGTVAESADELLKEMLKSSQDGRYLNYLICKSDMEAMKNFVGKALAGEIEPSPSQLSAALSYLVKTSNNTSNNTMDYVIRNFDAICDTMEKIGGAMNRKFRATMLLQECFAVAYTPERTKELHDLMDRQSHRISPNMTMLRAEIESNTEANQWKNNEFPKMNRWFRDHSIHV